jgi:transposase
MELQENCPRSKIHRSYTKEFKDQVVGVYKSGVYETVKDCAVAYGISPKTLSGWLNNYYKKSTPSALSDQQAELEKLKKELARAKMENEILKKAAIYFANQAK